MIESQFTRALNKDIKKINPSIYTWKIMTGGNNGLPDCYASAKYDIWYEVKYLNQLPKRDSTLLKPNLSVLQMNWLDDRDEQGRNVTVIVGSPDGCCVFHKSRGISWHESVLKEEFCMTRKQVAQWLVNQIVD